MIETIAQSPTIVGLVAAISPFIISGLTSLVKRLPVFENLYSGRTLAVRVLAAVIALLYVLAGLWVAPESFDPTQLTGAVETVVLAFVAWASSLGVFHGFQPKRTEDKA